MQREDQPASPGDAPLGAWPIHWVLRISVFLCFVGHGAFGLRQKPEWLAFIRPFGFSDDTGLRLMPLIGSFDIFLGCLALVRPTRVALLLNVFWGVFTASLRPLAGMSFFETLERAGNYGPALALLVGAGGLSLFARIPPHDFKTPSPVSTVRAILVGTTALLLLGHGGLAAMGKPMLAQHWASIGFGGNSPGFTPLIGWLEISAAIVVVLRPTVALCLMIMLWKLFTESLFVTSGAPFWEVVERGGSYGAPLALAVLLWSSRTPAVCSSPRQIAEGV